MNSMHRTRLLIPIVGFLIIASLAIYLVNRFQLFADSPVAKIGTPTNLTARAAKDDVILNWSKGTGRQPYTYIVYKSTAQNGTYKRVNTKRLQASDYRDINALKNTPTLWYKIVAVQRNGNRLTETVATVPIRVTGTEVSTTPPTPPSDTAVGRTLYVGAAGNDTNNTCLDPNNRCRQIRYALTQVVAGTNTTISIGDNATYDGFSVRDFGANLSDADATTKPLTIKAEGKNIILNPNGRETITIYAEKVKGLVLEGIKIDNTGRNSVRILDSAFVTIKNSEFYRGASSCLLLVRTNNVLLENVTVANSETGHGIYFSDNTDSVTIQNSSIYGNGAAGIQINAEKLPGDNAASIAKNILIENNIIRDNGWAGGAALNLLGVQDSIIQGNLLNNNYAGGIAAVWADENTAASLRPTGGPKNLKILNNMIIMAIQNPRRSTVAVRYAVSFIDSFGTNELRNNTIYHPEGKTLAFSNKNQADSANLTSDGNIYKVGSHISLYDGTKKFSLSEWQSANLTWSGSNNRRNPEHDQSSTTTNLAADSLAAAFMETYSQQ